ncbi:MAG: efflux RND transporter periplasmic adaptor subunit [Chloroflexota bacterium]
MNIPSRLFSLMTAAGLVAVTWTSFPFCAPTPSTASAAAAQSTGNAPSKDEFDEFEEKPSVEVQPGMIQKFGVKTVEVERKSLTRTLRAPGIVMNDETSLYIINTKIPGWIEKLYLNYTGKHVRKGEPLAEIYSPDLVSTQEELLIFSRLAARGKGTYADLFSGDSEKLTDAAKRRLKYWDITDEQVEDILKTGATRKTMTVYSTVDGYVVKRTATEGMKVSAGQELFQIADLSKVWIIADIYEQDLPLVKVGQAATISLSSLPGMSFNSTTDYVYPELSGQTRTVKVRFSVDNPKGILKPSMYTEVTAALSAGTRLAIPEDTVIDDGIRKVVFVARDRAGGVYEPREVLLGDKVEGYYEVLKGLKKGDRVVKGANFMLDSEAQLRGVKPLKEW